MSVPETVTQESLNKFVHDAKAKLAAVDTHSERLAAIDVLSKQLLAEVAAAKIAALEAQGSQRSEGDVSVERAYTAAPGAVPKSAVTQLGTPIDGSRGKSWVGSSGGVVRLLAGNAPGYGLLDDPSPKSEWQGQLQQIVEEMAWVKGFHREPSPRQVDQLRRHLQAGPPSIRKVFADNAGEGGEFIPSIPLAMMQRTAELPRTLESLIPTMPMANSTVTYPFLTYGAQPHIHGVPTAGDNNPAVLPKSVPSTAERTLTARTLTVNVPIDIDAEEDSIIDAIPMLQRLVQEAILDGTEDALINGDTAAAHGDTAFATWNPRSRWQTLGSSTDHRRGWVGFRQRAYDVSSTVDQNATQTAVGYLAQKAGLTSPHGLGSCVLIISPENYLAKLVNDSNLLTVDKFGDRATIVTGQVGSIGDSPVVLSDFMTADLAASGLYTGSGALTGAIWVNMARFVMGVRRGLRVDVEVVRREHTSYIVASVRKVLHTFDSSSVKNVRYMYNLSSS